MSRTSAARGGRARRHERLTRHDRKRQTRDALLRSASQSISRDGLHGTSIDRIAGQAGYTKGAFYANFSSKEELFLVMLDEKFAAELARLDAAMPGEGEATAEARNAALDFLGFMDRDPEWPRLYREFAAYAARNETFRDEFAARQRALRARMAELFGRWAASLGVEAPLPLLDIAAMVFVMGDGFLLDREIDHDLGDELYATMSTVFLRGLMAMSADEPG